MYKSGMNYIDYLNSVINKIIDANLVNFKESDSFQVRPGYSYDNFYLDRVQGSYDGSLNGLIHHIMFEDGIYKDLLTDEQFKRCKKAVDDEPEGIWLDTSISEDHMPDDSLVDELEDIYASVIEHVCKRLNDEGFQVEELNDYCEDF
tara:strand:+ start:172 stop:612 length:441 start_codon:yes stop_codon:yes gene_type:complete